MIVNPHNPVLLSIREYLLSNLGLNYTEKHDKLLLRKLEDAAIAFQFNNAPEFIDFLLNNQLNQDQLGKLSSFLTIGETYFFREKKSFDFLEQIYLPGLIHKRFEAERRIRIWCAGSASGEEAYSLAIALTHSIPDIHRWNISILATDINPVFLDKARKGVYTRWSLRASSHDFINKYFTRVGANEYHINPEIRKMVHFEMLNLAGNSFPSAENNTQAIDIIFCRNVLIYFSHEGIQQVTDQFYNSLVEGGILVVSPVEMSHLISPKFNKIMYSGYTIYQKTLESCIVENSQTDSTKSDFVEILKELNKTLFLNSSNKPEISQIQPLEIPQPVQNFKIDELGKAKELITQEHYTEADSILNKNAYPENKEVIFLRAKSKANQGKLQEAKELCEAGIELDKLDADIYYLLATILQELGNDVGAITALRMAIYIRHDFVLAYFLLGTLELKAGNPAAGKKSFRNALISLTKYTADDILPDSDGLTVGRFQEMLAAMVG